MTTRPNIIVLMSDQHRAMSMGAYGSTEVLTPNLDRFAGDSLVLTQAVANYPVCSPSRAMLMTGQYPHRNHVLDRRGYFHFLPSL